jgi:hypothetical protein
LKIGFLLYGFLFPKHAKADENSRNTGQRRMAASGDASSAGLATRRMGGKRAYSLASFSVTRLKNEETVSEKHPGSVEPLRFLHQRWRVQD